MFSDIKCGGGNLGRLLGVMQLVGGNTTSTYWAIKVYERAIPPQFHIPGGGSGEGLVTRLVEGSKCGANGTRHIRRFGRFLLLLQSLYLCLLVLVEVLYGGIRVCNMIIQLWSIFMLIW